MKQGLSEGIDQSDLVVAGRKVQAQVELAAGGVGVYADLLIDRAVLEADDLAVGEFTVDVDRLDAVEIGTCVQQGITGLVGVSVAGIDLDKIAELNSVAGFLYLVEIHIVLIGDGPVQLRLPVADTTREGGEGNGEGVAAIGYGVI